MVDTVGGMALLLLLLCLGSGEGLLSLGSLDLKELRDVQYSIQILDTPVSEESQPTDDTTTAMVMVNRDGQRYRCQVPKVEDKSLEEEDQSVESETDVESLLAPLEAAPCIFKTKDWWTYEICYKREIRQYHVENDRPVGLVMVLGVHSGELDDWGASNRTYQPQHYVNGSNCDLTSRPRQTELRFVCNEAATVEFVGDIFEPQSCEYTIVLHTARLCSVPWLRPVAESTPLPIECSPLLAREQFDKYQVYQRKKAVAAKLVEREKKAKQAEAVAAAEGVDISRLGVGGVGAGGLLELMGDNMADRLVGEINTLLDTALARGEGGAATLGGVKVVSLKGEQESPAVEVQQYNRLVEGKAEKWDLVHSPHKPVDNPELQELINQRNSLWRKIHEAKKMVKKYTSQLHDTETFIKNENMDAFQNKEILEKLEQTKKVIEKALVKAREDVAGQEELAKDVAHKLVAQQKKLAKVEEFVWKRKLEILHHKLDSGAEQQVFSVIVKELAHDYKKATGEDLVKIDDYFKYARKFVTEGGLDLAAHEKLRKFMQFANKDLAMMAIEQIKSNGDDEIKELEKELAKMSAEKKETVAKFRDVVKDDVREKFSDILKEVSEELKLPEGDVDQEEAMKAMSQTLDQLISKLAGSSEKMKAVQKQAVDLKKVANEVVNLKRDGKQSVKKELRDEGEPSRRSDITIEEKSQHDEIFGDVDDAEDAKLDSALSEARKNLLEAEAEVDELEREWKRPVETANELGREGDGGNVKVSVTKMGAGVGEEISEEQAAAIAKRLEGTIKDKLAKLGIDTGSRPIEVKLITTSMPEGLVLGEEGDPQNDQQVQSMFFNMMTGNIQGYEDIDSQRKAESSYKFAWNEDMMEDLDSRIATLGGDSEEVVETGGEAAATPEEVRLAGEAGHNDIWSEIMAAPDIIPDRERPSSAESKIDITEGESEDKDEL